MRKIWIICAVLVLALPAAAHAGGGGRVELTIATVRVEQGGDILVALFSDEDSWTDMDKAYAKKALSADADTMVAVFEGVPPGLYAAEVVHDKNRNGDFDMRWFPFPKPKEGAGVSHNNLRRGKPRYEQAVFTVEAGMTLRLDIDLRY